MHPPTSVSGLGLDSSLACLTIAWCGLSWRSASGWHRPLARATTTPLSWAGRPHGLPEPSALVIYLLCALLLSLAARSNLALFYALPALLSIDTLYGGAPATMALLLGLGSATMAMFGLSLTAAGRRVIREGDQEV